MEDVKILLKTKKIQGFFLFTLVVILWFTLLIGKYLIHRRDRLQIPTKYREIMMFKKAPFDNCILEFKPQTVILIFLVISGAD